MSTTIRISRETKKMLEELGRKGQSFDDIVHHAAIALNNERFYEDMYFHFRDSNHIDLQYGKICLPKRSKGGKIKIHSEDIVESIYSICEEQGWEVEIK